jgi:hypothetical protein
MKSSSLALVLLAHSWYPQACCADQDCHPVPCENIHKIGSDYEWNQIVFPPEMVHSSHDALCHACASLNGHPHCLFIQMSA